jgi:dolichol-phosphate mannosyltransferase
MKRQPVEQVTVSVVLPVFNEAAVLPELASRIRATATDQGALYEIIFVNDGSSDGSQAVLDRLAAEDPQIRVIHFSRNFGHQAAIQAGLRHATGHCVVLMDSDLQDEPEVIGRFLDEWQSGSDVVYALRSERPEAWWKRALFDSFHTVMAKISATPIPAHAGNFCLMDRRVVRQIVALDERDRYLPGLRAWVGFSQKGIEVRRGARYDSTPRVSLWGLCRLAKTAVFSFSSLPLAVFYWIGLVSLGVFGMLGGFAMFSKLFTSWAIPGWTSEVLVASFFGAINALGISILGEYVTRIYDQVRSRPLYLVARTCNVANVARSTERLPSADWDEAELCQALLDQAEELKALARSTGEPSPVKSDAASWPSAERRRRTTPAKSRAKASGKKPAAKRVRKTRSRQTK